MFTLFSDIYKTWTLREEYTVLVIGPTDAGKSTLLNRLIGQPERPTRPTIGQSLSRVVRNETRFKLLEVGGTMTSLWKEYFPSSHIVLFVVDFSSSLSYSDVLEQIKESGIPLLFIGNKSDLCEEADYEDTKEQLHDGILCSAKSGQGVDQVLSRVHDLVLANKVERPPERR